MNEETINKLIQLTPAQKALMDVARNALNALCLSGVGLFYDYNDYTVRAVNLTAFKHTEVDDGRYEDEWHKDGCVTIPYWNGESFGDYACFMCTDDYLYGQVPDRDKNLFN